MNNVFSLFVRTAAIYGKRPWLCVTAETAVAYSIPCGDICYNEARERVLLLRARYIEAGYGPGQRVGLLLENRPDFFVHWFALNGLGVSIVPLNPDLRIMELSYVIAHSEVVAIVAIPSRHLALREAAGGRAVSIVSADSLPAPVTAGGPALDEAALLYTSGTTGRPKGCVLPNSYFLAAGDWYARLGGVGALRPGMERMATPLPLFHMNALAYSAMAMLVLGGCLIPLDRFHPRSWWRTVSDSGATVVHYLGVMPAILMANRASPDDRAHTIRFGFGAGVDSKLHAPFEDRFGFPLVEAWAMTETGAGAVIAANEEPRHVGTHCFGRPSADVAFRIVDEGGADVEQGELLVRHSGCDPRFGFFREYLKDPDATEEAWADGWFHTGDVVRRGLEGSLHFVDRRKNVIRRSGENIAAVEVESALRQHPAVSAVAVAPYADPLRGEEVFACIVTSADANETLARDITAWCVDRLAYYKAPGYVAFVTDLPLTSTQKIQRAELRTLVESVGASAYDTRGMKRRPA